MSKRYNNKKTGWRQQKVSINTIKKIATSISKYQDRKSQEPKYSLVPLGTIPTDFTGLPNPYIIMNSGAYKLTVGPQNINVQDLNLIAHHPQTTQPVPVQGAAINTSDSTRIGDTIRLTRLSCTGTIVLPQGCEDTKIHIGIYSSKSLQLNPRSKLVDANNMTSRRAIEDFQELNHVASKTFIMRHNIGAQVQTNGWTYQQLPQGFPAAEFKGSFTKKAFSLQVKFKGAGKRVRYNQDSTQILAGQDYADLRYYLVMYSDRQSLNINGGIGIQPVASLNKILNEYPSFYGKWTAYYRDA